MIFNPNFFEENIKKKLQTGKRITFTGLTAFSRLLLVKYIKEHTGKKIIFITSTEQAGLKYCADLEKMFGMSPELFPYMSISPYETLPQNFYDYCKQIKLLLQKPDFIVMPIKAVVEKFPSEEFFEKSCFSLKIGDSISQKDLLNKLIALGYTRSTMVSDMGEFSIRGDISDIYTLYNLPVRIEFWGDEIVDIRVFDNETQKSVEKVK